MNIADITVAFRAVTTAVTADRRSATRTADQVTRTHERLSEFSVGTSNPWLIDALARYGDTMVKLRESEELIADALTNLTEYAHVCGLDLTATTGSTPSEPDPTSGLAHGRAVLGLLAEPTGPEPPTDPTAIDTDRRPEPPAR